MATNEKDPRVPRGPSQVDQLGSDRREDSPEAYVSQLPITLGSIRKNSQDEVRVGIEEYRGQVQIDVRIHSSFTTANVFFATKKGVSLNIAHLPALIRLLEKAEEEARAAGLLDDGDA